MRVDYYNGFKNSLVLNNGNFQFLTDEIKVLLLTDQYVFDPNHTTISALISGDEISGPGYITGGKTLVSKSRVNQALFAANLSWPQITANISGALLYKAAGGALMAHFNFQFTYSPTAEEFQINWHEEGMIKFSTS